MQIKSKVLKVAQLVMLDILIEIDKICKKNNIKYWIDSGTLLGAVRNKGFIPWDDDLDITMTLEDYKKFCKIAYSELPQDMFLQNSDTDKAFPYDFTKVRSSRGKIVEKHEVGKDIKYNQGLFIDILPCIAIKDNYFHRISYTVVFAFIKLFSYGYINIRPIRRFFISIGDMFHVGWDYNACKVVRSGRLPSFYMNLKKSTIFPLKQITFEEKEFLGPNDIDDYLKVYYGKNYMTLPPKNKRKTHAHSIEIFDAK